MLSELRRASGGLVPVVLQRVSGGSCRIVDDHMAQSFSGLCVVDQVHSTIDNPHAGLRQEDTDGSCARSALHADVLLGFQLFNALKSMGGNSCPRAMTPSPVPIEALASMLDVTASEFQMLFRKMLSVTAKKYGRLPPPQAAAGGGELAPWIVPVLAVASTRIRA